MKVIYDLVFFAKEQFGGISRCWMELFKCIPGTPIDPVFLVGPADNLTQNFLAANGWFDGEQVAEAPRGVLRKLRLLGFWRTFQLLDVGRHRGEAIFHSTDYINPLIRPPGLKIVTTIHDMVFWDQADRFDKNIWYWDKRCMTWHALRISDAIVTVSEASRRAILDRFPWAEEKIVVIRHGLSDTLRSIAFQPEKKKRFLFIGGRNAYKNFDLLLDAFALFAPDYPDWDLHVVGENTYTAAAERRRYEALGIAQRVIDHGLVPQEALNRLLAESAAVVIPSLNEGFNFPLLEGMAAGVPVLSSDIPVSLELGQNHVRYFSPLSTESLTGAMRALADSPPDTAQLLAAQAYARSFDWRTSMSRLVDVYQGCLS